MRSIILPPSFAGRCDAFLASIHGYVIPDVDWVLPSNVWRQMENYRRGVDRSRFIIARHVLWRALGVSEPFGKWLGRWAVGSHGKPHICGGPCFSLSHSGDYVAVAVSPMPVGIDIEVIMPIDVRDFTVVLNRGDWSQIYAPSWKVENFFEIWTRKEAVAKALGVGLSGDFAHIWPPVDGKVLFGGHEWEVHSCAGLFGYSLSVAVRCR